MLDVLETELARSDFALTWALSKESQDIPTAQLFDQPCAKILGKYLCATSITTKPPTSVMIDELDGRQHRS